MPLPAAADPWQQQAQSFLNWSWKLKRAERQGLTAGEFVRCKLDTLGLAADLETMTVGKNNISLQRTGTDPQLSVSP